MTIDHNGLFSVRKEGFNPLYDFTDINFSFQYSTQISTFSEKAKAIILSMDPTNELYYLRVTSRKHEILVAPDNDFVLIVLQSPSAE